MQTKATRGRPIKPATIKGRNYRAIPRQRADGSVAWSAQVYNAQAKARQVVGTFDTPEEAVQACQQALGVLSDGPSITVAAVHRRWLEAKRAAKHERNSIRYAEDATKAFVAAYGAEPAKAITKGIAEDWVQTHPWHTKPLHAMFNYAADRLDAVPASVFKGKTPAPRSRQNPDLARRSLTEPELDALARLALARYGGLTAQVLVLWMGYGGQRIAEAVDTHTSALELLPSGNAKLLVGSQWRQEEKRSRHTKQKDGGHYAIIPAWVVELARPLIQAAEARDGELHGLLFLSKTGKRLSPQNFRNGYWNELRAEFSATLPERHWLHRKIAAGGHLETHELRHSASTIAREQTGDLNASRAQLGHAKDSMTIKYTHPENEAGLAALDAAYADRQVIPLRRRTS